MFQEREPVIERLAFGSKCRIEKDFTGPNVGAARHIVANLLQRTRKDHSVFAQRLVGHFEDRMHDHRDGVGITPRFLCHLFYGAERIGHDWYGEKDGIPPVGQVCQPFQRLRDKCSQVDGRMRLLHGLEVNIRLGHMEELTVKFNGIRGPNGFQQRQKFICQRASFRHISAGSVDFVFIPAET